MAGLDGASTRAKWEPALEVLLMGAADSVAAEAAGVSVRTIERWRANEEFRRIFAERLEKLTQSAADRLAAWHMEMADKAAERMARAIEEPGRRGAWAADRVMGRILRLAGRDIAKHEVSGEVNLASILRQVAETGPLPEEPPPGAAADEVVGDQP